jgi:hypothetical protein
MIPHQPAGWPGADQSRPANPHDASNDHPAAPAPIVGTRAPSVRQPVDTALRELDRALAACRVAEVPTAVILGRVANGITGRLNGYHERALTRRWMDVVDEVADVDVADLKAAEQRAQAVTDEAAEVRTARERLGLHR